MSNAIYLGQSIDSPPVAPSDEGCGHVWEAERHMRSGRRVPMDLAQDLMDSGIDLPAMHQHTPRYDF